MNADYVCTTNGLSSEIVDAPLHSVVGNNGVYALSQAAFPTNSYQNSNYFVDVVFSGGAPTTQTVAFQQGAGTPAYAGAVDTYVSSGNATTSYGTNTELDFCHFLMSYAAEQRLSSTILL